MAALRAELVSRNGTDEGEETTFDPIDEGPSLRTRLTRAVESKRATGGDDDTNQWR
jgi:hypothetical protein